MPYYAETICDNGHARELNVFASMSARDEWVADEIPEGNNENGYEEGPRSEISGINARRAFSEHDYQWVKLHSGVRILGLRLNGSGDVYTPKWLDLYDYSEQWNTNTGIDWTKDVTYVWDLW